MGKLPNRIREVRESQGITLEQLSGMSGFSVSHLQRMEKGTRNVTLVHLENIAAALSVPPGALLPDGADASSLFESSEDDAQETGENGSAFVDGKRLTSRQIDKNAIPEIDTVLGAGGGGYPLPHRVNSDGRSYDGEMIRGEWQFPGYYLAGELQADLQYLDIVEVRGDSMTNDASRSNLEHGDRVIVNRKDKAIRQGGIFAVRDNDETIVKRVELVRNVEPMRIRCISVNPQYEPFELVLDGSAEVIGRVIRKITRL